MAPKKKKKAKFSIRENLLTILMISGILLGAVLGIIMQLVGLEYTKRDVLYMQFGGIALIHMLKFVAIPLMASCVVCAIGSLDLIVSRTLGWQLIVAFIATKPLGVALGMIIAVILSPGKVSYARAVVGRSAAVHVEGANTTAVDDLLDMTRNVLPPNIVSMLFLTYRSVLVVPPDNPDAPLTKWGIKQGGVWRGATNMMGTLCVVIMLGVASSILYEYSQPFLRTVKGLYEVAMQLTVWILWTSPVLLIFLIAGQILGVQSLGMLVAKVGLFALAVLVADVILLLILYPLVYLLVVRRNPFRIYVYCFPALITTYATSSTLATLPVLIRCMEESPYDARMLEFLLPVLVSISKDGLATYYGVAFIFMAQLTDHELGIGGYVTVLILGTTASAAVAGVPYAGIIALIIMLNTLNIPANDVGLLMACDWFVDRYGCVTTIAGDVFIATILMHFNKNLMDKIEAGKSEQAAAEPPPPPPPPPSPPPEPAPEEQ